MAGARQAAGTAANGPDSGNLAGKAELVAGLAGDLAAEGAELAQILRRLPEAGWDAPTPAQGWAIRDQVTHLAFFDDTTLLSLRDAAAFRQQAAQLRSIGEHYPDVVAQRHRHLPGGEVFRWFTTTRASLLKAYRAADPAARLPWYGPDFSVPSSITGRLMETWAHGQDIADAAGVTRAPTARLRHVAEIGIRALPFTFASRGLTVPAQPVRVALAGPGGEAWTWGPADAPDVVTGDALDFCLVVTQRRNVADTQLAVAGEVATRWISIAQAFAGPPTGPRPPRSTP